MNYNYYFYLNEFPIKSENDNQFIWNETETVRPI